MRPPRLRVSARIPGAFVSPENARMPAPESNLLVWIVGFTLLGGLLFIFPVLAIWAIITELRFGLKVEKLAKKLDESGQWPHFDYELRPSGRPTRASADAEFGKFRDAAYADPGNWTRWFALGLAYDAASDRRRARACMRKAIKLSE